MKTILGVMQNQWFHRPERVRAILDRQPTEELRYRARQRLISYALFAGCKSGCNLLATFGQDLCNRIVWEEASTQIGGHAASVFPAEPAHLLSVIAQEEPDIIIGFGKIACDGLRAIGWSPLIEAPHPAARQPDTIARLRAACLSLQKSIAA